MTTDRHNPEESSGREAEKPLVYQHQGTSMQDLHSNILPRLQPEEAGYLRDELDGLRSLVTRGDALVAAGGPAMAWWGVCLAMNWAVGAAVALGLLSRDLMPWNLIFIAAGYGGNFIIGMMRPSRVPMLQPWRTQAVSTMWLFTGAGIILITLGRNLTGHGDENDYSAFCCVLFALVHAVMASSSRRTWLFLSAGGWLVTAASMFVLPDTAIQRGVMCVAMLVFMTAPGLVLARAEAEGQP